MAKTFLIKLLLIAVSFTFFVLWVNSVSAEFKSTEKKSDSITFSWESVENALIYKINYGNISWTYDKSTDYIDALTYSIFDLTPWTQYYFSLVWLDEDANEIYKSSELSITTPELDEKSDSTLKNLSLEKAEMVWENMIEISFSNDISDKDEDSREFMIENTKDSNELLEVTKSEISKTNKKNLILTLDEKLKVGNTYKVTVLNIRDIYDQNIEFWVDSEAIFTSKAIEESIIELNSASEEETVLEATTLESTWGEVGNISWVDLNSAWVDASVLTEASEISKLPQTWPKEILIFLLAVVLSWIVFAYRFRKV